MELLDQLERLNNHLANRKLQKLTYKGVDYYIAYKIDYMHTMGYSYRLWVKVLDDDDIYANEYDIDVYLNSYIFCFKDKYIDTKNALINFIKNNKELINTLIKKEIEKMEAKYAK